MCTVIIYKSDDENNHWPILLAANRDEKPDRPWLIPSNHWPNYEHIKAGLDIGSDSRGSWIGVNDNGMLATVVNMSGTMGKKEGKKSRGDLVVEALKKLTVEEALEDFIEKINPEDYRGFYLIIADAKQTFVIISDESNYVTHSLSSGLHMVTSRGIDNLECDRTSRHIDEWKKASLPNPEINDWDAWINILMKKAENKPRDAMTLIDVKGIFTVSSSLIAINRNKRTRFLFSSEAPKQGSFKSIPLIP